MFFETEGGFPYTLTAPLIYESDLLKATLIVPEGFKTDLASVPRGLWNLIPKSGKQDRPAVIHDFLYVHNGVSRSQADAILNEAMAVCGVGRVSRWIIYSGVRVGGWQTWNRYRAKD